VPKETLGTFFLSLPLLSKSVGTGLEKHPSTLVRVNILKKKNYGKNEEEAAG
jgi:hypothetical protein